MVAVVPFSITLTDLGNHSPLTNGENEVQTLGTHTHFRK